MTFFDLWWLLWLGGMFLFVELWAHFDKKPGGTLSEWVWKIYIYPKRYAHLCRFIFGAFWGGLSLHFLFHTSVIPIVLFGALMVLPIYWYYSWD